MTAAVSRDPDLFIELLGLAFRAEDEELKEVDDLSEDQAARARMAYDVLSGFHWTPGVAEGWSELETWYEKVRDRAIRCKRRSIADVTIGQAVARVPAGADGVWPIEAVRDLLERTPERAELETGLRIGVANNRGVVSRAIGEGGKQERELASSYRQWSHALSGTWPSTAVLLRKLAEDHGRDATSEDIRSEIHERRYR